MCTTFPFAETLSNGKCFGWLTSGVFPHDRHSPRRDTTAQACRFSCFFCAAYGLLLTQTRTQCSNSASRAIAMLEKSAKISPNAWAVVSLPDKRGHAENSYIFVNDADFALDVESPPSHSSRFSLRMSFFSIYMIYLVQLLKPRRNFK